ncbi:MAG: hypothetical protein AAGH83_03880 [Pseudomonadota bacterium]
MNALAWMGRHATALLALGFLIVPLLPLPGDAVRPLLPVMVAIVTGLAVARQPAFFTALRDVLHPRVAGSLIAWHLAVQIAAAAIFVGLGHGLGWPRELTLMLVVFCAAPSITSAPNFCLMLGYNFPLALRLSLFGTLLSPLLVPIALGLAGFESLAGAEIVAVKVLSILAGGVALGVAIQRLAGPARVAANPEVFDGLTAIAMIGFLVPLMAGARAAALAAPLQVLGLLALASVLGLGGTFGMRWLAGRFTDTATARALGLLFGSRNVGLVLAILPYDSLVTLFVAAMQLPIFGAPLLMSVVDRTRPGKSPSPPS